MSGNHELQDVVRDLSDPTVIMGRVVDQALVLITAADGATVELEDAGYLSYVCAGGSLSAYVGTRLAIGDSLSGLSVSTGETLICHDTATDSRVNGEACRKVGAVSMVCVPLRRESKPIGVLKVTSKLPNAFTEADVEALRSLAEFIATAIAAVSDIARITSEVSATFTATATATATTSAEASTTNITHRSDLGVGAFIANVLRPGSSDTAEIKERIEEVLSSSRFAMHCQPIIRLDTGELTGVEALARFTDEPYQPPDVWFGQANAVGLGVDLQLAAVNAALKLANDLPENTYLAFNIGPDAMTDPRFAELLKTVEPARVVLELTEHLRVDDYPQMATLFHTIRASGVRLAIDDTGAGFASLANIINLAPDLIKLDRQLITGIDFDPVRRSLAQALVGFAADTGAEVVAEGIENQAELDIVRDLGIGYGQGYFIARPAPIENMHTGQLRLPHRPATQSHPT